MNMIRAYNIRGKIPSNFQEIPKQFVHLYNYSTSIENFSRLFQEDPLHTGKCGHMLM